MKCSIKKEDLIAFIYDEINDEKKRMIEEHINNCPECAEEIASLKSGSNILKKWKVDVPDMDSAIIRNSILTEGKIVPFRKRVLHAGYVFAAAAAVILVVLSVLNFKIEYDESGFSVSMSLWGNKNDVYLTQDLLKKLEDNQQRTEDFILQAIAVSEERMRVERVKITSDLIDVVQKQRAIDMVAIGENMEYLHTYAAEGFRKSNEIMDELLTVTKTGLSK